MLLKCISFNTYFSTGKPHLSRLHDPLWPANRSILDSKKKEKDFGLQIDNCRFFKILGHNINRIVSPKIT